MLWCICTNKNYWATNCNISFSSFESSWFDLSATIFATWLRHFRSIVNIRDISWLRSLFPIVMVLALDHINVFQTYQKLLDSHQIYYLRLVTLAAGLAVHWWPSVFLDISCQRFHAAEISANPELPSSRWFAWHHILSHAEICFPGLPLTPSFLITILLAIAQEWKSSALNSGKQHHEMSRSVWHGTQWKLTSTWSISRGTKRLFPDIWGTAVCYNSFYCTMHLEFHHHSDSNLSIWCLLYDDTCAPCNWEAMIYLQRQTVPTHEAKK